MMKSDRTVVKVIIFQSSKMENLAPTILNCAEVSLLFAENVATPIYERTRMVPFHIFRFSLFNLPKINALVLITQLLHNSVHIKNI